MTTETDAPQVETETPVHDYAAKIQKLLERAQGTDNDAERELCMAQATRLMDKYAITEAMLGSTKERDTDVIETMSLDFTGIYGQTLRGLASAIANSNRCRCVIVDRTWEKPKRYTLRVHGFTSDLATVKLLDASLQLQCASALKAWEKEQGWAWKELPAFAKFKDKREFIESFSASVSAKLRASMKEAVHEAAEERSAETNGAESVADATAGVQLALRTRTDKVDDWFDKKYGNSLRFSKGRRQASGSFGASMAGHTAGRNADTGQPKVGGGARAIGK